MISKSYLIRTYAFNENDGTMTKKPALYFSSDSRNKQFIAMLVRQKIKETPSIDTWSIALVQVYDYEKGDYVEYSNIFNKKKRKE